MRTFDVLIVGGGPAGSSCAAFCALAGLQTVLLEREKFPREKVCGDCLNPSCWTILERLQLRQRVQSLPHAKLSSVEFITINRRTLTVDLPSGGDCEISVKRSLFDNLLLRRARVLGAEVHEGNTVTGLSREGAWKIQTASGEVFRSRLLIGADGRNSIVARLCNLLARSARDRVALQAHVPLPRDFGNRVVLQFLLEGYSGQAPVNENELNVCVVGRPATISRLRTWAENEFQLPADQPWRTITPLTRSPVRFAEQNLFFVGDAARVVEPFTGEGIYYALRSGELIATAAAKIVRCADQQLALDNLARDYNEMYRGRLWVNRLARAAVVNPRLGSSFVRTARLCPSIMKLLTAKVVSS